VAGGGDILDAQRQVMWQRGGWWQTRGVLDAQHRATWQSIGQKGSGRQGGILDAQCQVKGGGRQEEASLMLDLG